MAKSRKRKSAKKRIQQVPVPVVVKAKGPHGEEILIRAMSKKYKQIKHT